MKKKGSPPYPLPKKFDLIYRHFMFLLAVTDIMAHNISVSEKPYEKTFSKKVLPRTPFLKNLI